MSFPRYEHYKDSGVEWLGEVPKHWETVRLRFLTQIETGSADTVDATDDGEYPFFVRSSMVEKIDKYTHDCEAVLTAGDGVGVGKVFHHFEGKFCAHQRVYIFRDFREIKARFFFHYIKELFQRVVLEGTAKSTVDSLRRPMIADFLLTTPPLEEQQTISTFLDRETAKIDALVAEQQRLIELLEEKRQAVISHAVTKGLNPDVSMKDSGVEWLREVPEHWELKLFRRVIKKIEQGWSPNAASDPCEPGNWGVLKLSAIKQGAFFPCENKKLLAETDPNQLYEIKVGDLLITRANTPKFVGDACVVTHPNDYRLMLSDLIYRIHLNPLHDVNYICQFLISSYGRYQIEADARGSSMTMAKISQEHINAWIFPTPPFEEQREIANHLNFETAKFNTLISEAQRAITLLQERRTSLISAAVTGKIDVRGLVSEKQAME